MTKRVLLRLAVALATMIALVGVRPSAAFAQPVNDDFAGATTIGSLPYSTTQDTLSATVDPSDPEGCHENGSVWYAFTPSSDMLLQVSTLGSDYSTVLSAWTGTQGSLVQAACNFGHENADFEPESRIVFPAAAGTTYYFMIVPWFDDDEEANLQLSVDEVSAPGNDNFADATAIDEIPFSTEEDLGAAGMETGEPIPSCGPVKKTVWYSYTPTTTQSVTAKMNYWGGVVAYTGTSLTDLTPIGCSNRLTFRAEAGTTYLFQVTESRCCTPEPESGLVAFELDVAPDPIADFYFRPRDPSTVDTITFDSWAADPGRVGIASWLWDFGDGTTSTEPEPSHRYTADGDYTVRHTVTTPDGRTASTTQVIAVRTHDVSVSWVRVPVIAFAKQTVTITVYVRNTHLPETVRVDLSKSVSGSFTQVGSLTQPVPVEGQPGGITSFVFKYRVTTEDGAAGRIAFRADATLVGTRDAVPANNTLISRSVIMP